ncbi:MAG: DUF1641 domain-containing protein [Acidimicrobiia bacterium]|nr:DUF1641 domain-containing protein [Acidimicrobiia bacterium]
MVAVAQDTDRLEAKIDQLADQVAWIADEVAAQRRRRESMEELTEDLMPIATRSLAAIGDELDEADISLEDLKRLLLKVASSASRFEALLDQLESVQELVADVAPMSTDAVASLTARAAEFEEKGYFTFIRQAGGIVDQIVTNYSEEDVAALGDNVVLILDTVKEMTQPDIMGLLRSTATALHEQADQVEQGAEEVPSLFGLLSQMRDPQVRLGMQRALGMLKSISGDTPEGSTPPKEER